MDGVSTLERANVTKRLLLLVVLTGTFGASGGQVQAPLSYELDAFWPKPLPEKWITGQLGGVCVRRECAQVITFDVIHASRYYVA